MARAVECRLRHPARGHPGAAYTDDMAIAGTDAVAVPAGGEKTRLIGPFQPGPGKLPPYLAGREQEQALFRGWGDAVAQGVPPPSPVILYGPRGNGKTALLVWLQRHLAALPGMDVVRLTPSRIRTPALLAGALLSDAWLARFAPKELSVVGLTWRPGGDRTPPTAEDTIRLRAGKRPLTLLLDEAHTLSPEVGNELLNVSQELGAELPFFLVLAGTPDLEDRLSEMEASFWGRAKRIRLNRLGPGAAAAAIERPLHEDGMSIEAAALERILAESHGYPFFLQLWGQFSWDCAAPEGRQLITSDDVEAAAPEFEETRGDYYRQRYEELEKRQLLEAARALAEAFRGGATLSAPAAKQAVRGALGRAGEGAGLLEALTAMKHLGFIWRSGPTPAWEPGIPSLMDYIREYVPES